MKVRADHLTTQFRSALSIFLPELQTIYAKPSPFGTLCEE
jgi:hypothetical protein